MSVAVNAKLIGQALRDAEARGTAPHQTSLFGGAITALLPANAVSAEIMRPVDDNQEVFVFARKDTSVVVEALDALPVESAQNIAKEHFVVIADDNGISDASTAAIDSAVATDDSSMATDDSSMATDDSSMTTDYTPTAETIKQSLRQIQDKNYHILSIIDADPILVSGWQRISKSSHSPPQDVLICVAIWRIKSKNTDLVMTVNVPIESGKEDETINDGLQIWKTAADSLEIHDMSLFA